MNKAIIHEHGEYKPFPVPGVFPHLAPPPHERFHGPGGPRFEKHIFIRQANIFFSIDSTLSMLAKARRNPDGTENGMFARATTEYRPMFLEWIETHIGEAKEKMATFVLEHFHEGTMNDIKDKEETDIMLMVPEWYDDTTFDQLKNAVHNYIVDATLCDYFSITLTPKDPVFMAKEKSRDNFLAGIKKLANASKPGAIKKHLCPF